ncbi:MAG: hypothetical protein ACXWWC_12945 [Chitinophagaceae bacterium]
MEYLDRQIKRRYNDWYFRKADAIRPGGQASTDDHSSIELG